MSTKTILSIAERRKALEDRYPIWPRDTIARHFEKACSEYKDRPYMYIDGKELTYGEVWDLAVQYAKAFMKLGVKRRDHIAILMNNDATYPSLMIASSMVGAVFIPINAMLTKDELGYIVSQSDTQYLLVQQTVKNQRHAEVVAELLDTPEFQENSQIEKVIGIPTDEKDAMDRRFLLWNDFLKGSDSITDEEFQQRWDESRYPDEVAIIMYTSGSTGSPKGVMLTEDMLLRASYATCMSRAIEDGRVTFAPLPFYHCFAIIEAILAMSFVGGSFISALGASPLQSLQLMEKYKANDYLCVPSTLVPLLNHPRVSEFDLSNLFAMWCGAAPAPIPVWQKAMNVLGLTEMITGYGQTEVSSSGVTTEIGDPLERISTRVGRPKLGGSSSVTEFNGSNVQYKTIDPDTRKTLPAGSVGELVVRGNTVTHGYYKKPKETAEAIDKDGWLRTGDVGRIDENGYIQLLGRSKEMYKVSGELVSPREVEVVISEHPAVSQVNVIGVPDSITTEIGAAFIELKLGETCTRRDIIEWCSSRLAKFKIPRHVWFVEASEWPMTSTGKVQKFRLKDIVKAKLS
ncbi:acyl--CoA ligase [Oceanobacillus caeni]|uniref:class I adenylate-forming enzyme family protein n=1 Tax=Oceanobacillus TaxID=182709 RepID=UPI0006227B3E|nr:class I adenylate-forming enzyme family protein [Oceanobacillus caeni]KKE80401.1 AMP-dependent synthetase [Bacilli bacterium VT-13-104]PZD83399.1 long-chain fatty acid--CoA ligase [Bacilli bacterium]MCR1834708.1 acyl--CoA ligase [Oceanobacillus caeni]PZD84578.1 long-chain fatty acid--CoA ligase [Bacilli bacterium]PZD86864.1 long-chain fatty acid--CoA ligase [Bacilli bacterium]